MSRPFSLPLLLLVVALLSGCGGGRRVVADARLPENVMTQPIGSVAVIGTDGRSPLFTALRALGVPARTLSLDSLDHPDLGSYATIIVDEMALADDRLIAGWRTLLYRVRTGVTLLVLVQPVEPMVERLRAMPHAVIPRAIEYQPRLATVIHSDPVLHRPNEITRTDLDSLATRTRQLVRSTSGDARAIIGGNNVSPDSSAVLLWDRFDSGRLWYLALPITERAAAGFPAEQRLLANLLSNR